MMTRLEALVGLNMVYEMGGMRLANLLACFGTPQNILNATEEKLSSVAGIGGGIAAKIRRISKGAIEKEISAAKKSGVNIISTDDHDYPAWLKAIPGAPPVLYVKGKLREQDSPAVAIVGSRRASFYGLSCAENFACGLAAKGITIVSGMARGIDTCAHRGALKGGGRTVAVIGSGFANIYPAENVRLAGEIAANGAVVSEFPMDMLPLRQNFPRRNRIISGLTAGVLVVEAAKNSGALITADFALEQGREVFALPGKVDAVNSWGTNGLIKQGARLVSCVEEILEELAVHLPEAPGREAAPPRKAGAAGGCGSPQEERVFSLIPEEPAGVDELAEKTNMDIPGISAILLKLQIRKLIRKLPGGRFARND